MNTTHIHIASVRALENPAVFNNLFNTVSALRQKKIQQLRFDSDKRLSLGVAVLLRQLLREENFSPDEMQFSPDSHGKPQCLSHPEIHVSLSHSGEYAMAALSCRAVGCDVEQLRDAAPLDVARRFFSEKEYNFLISLPIEKQTDAFFRLWSLKESFTKAVGTGITVPLNNIVPDLNTTPASFSGCENASIAVCEPDFSSKYACACCVIHPPMDHHFVWSMQDFN